jgi:N-glycosylase/DNA lyase
MRAVELNTEEPLDLAASLESGQAHRWEREGQWYCGVVRGNVIKLRQTAARIEFRGGPHPDASLLPLLHSYFRLDDDISAIYAEIGRDRKVADMIARFPGLRLLRIEPWECVVSFICSANSNLRRIHQSMERLAEGYGSAIRFDGREWHAFPTPAELAEAGEDGLRRLGLGFRAPYVAKATQMVLEGRLDLAALARLPYAEARAGLMECPGIGPKVADCICLFSLDKTEAFPVDVWVRRALAEWYFPGREVLPDRELGQWAQDHFGRFGGYSQQYLFYGRRLERQSAVAPPGTVPE